jgi:polysaccharide biosynthesis protein PelG
MAGVGLELRRMLAKDSYAGLVGAYGYAGVVACGPWVLSITGMLAIGLLAAGTALPAGRVTQFLVTITWATAASLVLTGPLQLVLARFVADRIYERRRERILPNLLGALELATLASGAVSAAVVLTSFDESLPCRALLVATFVVLCDGWVLLVLLSGVKAYRAVVAVFLAAEIASVVGAVGLRALGLEGLLAGFLVGQAGAVFGMLVLVLRAFPGERRVRFDFLRPGQARYELAAVGLVFHVGIWVDKAAFWLDPATSSPVIGPLRASVLYDLPIFLAYLSAIPAMAAFFLRLEADFAGRCEEFLAAARGGAPLRELEGIQDGMIACVRRGLVEILEIQGVVLVVVLAAGPAILAAAGLSPLYLELLRVDAAGVSLQVVFLAILNVLFYLDEPRAALALSAVFAVANAALTLLTQRLGPAWYGLGFAAAALLASAAGVTVLARKLEGLDRSIFMRQPLWPAAPRGRGLGARRRRSPAAASPCAAEELSRVASRRES